MLVTVTPYLRIHRDEVIYVRVASNTVVLRFVSMKPMRIPIDDLTQEAMGWLLPTIAPRGIPIEEPDECAGEDADDEVVDVEHTDRPQRLRER